MNASSITRSAGSLSAAVPVPRLDVLVTLIGVEVDRARSGTGMDGPDDEDRAVFDRLAIALRGLVPGERPLPTTHPAVDRWLDAAVTLAPEQQTPLADAFRSVAPYLVWKTAYTSAPASPTMRRFWDSYTFAPLASVGGDPGRAGPLLSGDMNLYLVIQGAGVEYGRHRHPAIEVYGIVSGAAHWLKGDGTGFLARRSGDVFVHQPDVVHATTTGVEPTISWVAWLGDLDSPPLLETPDGPVVVG